MNRNRIKRLSKPGICKLLAAALSVTLSTGVLSWGEESQQTSDISLGWHLEEYLLNTSEAKTPAAETESETTEETEETETPENEPLWGSPVLTVSAPLSADAPCSLRSLWDYRELRSFPLPALPLTIQVLETRLASLIDSYSGKWSVYVKNLSTGDSFTLRDLPMKSASVMKLFIMGAVYDAIEKNELERTQEIVDLLHNMITYSSNSDSNRLLFLLGNGDLADGIEAVNQYIRDHHYSRKTREYNGFNDTNTILDPLHSNRISARDCGELLERVYHREFGSRRVCNEIEDMLLHQDTRYKIPAGLPEGVEVGNKTGEMDTVENDAAIIYGEKSDYILCVLSADWEDKNEAISHIAEISAVTYAFFDDAAYYASGSEQNADSTVKQETAVQKGNKE